MDIREYEVKKLPYRFVLFYNLPANEQVVLRKMYHGTEEDNALLTYCYLDSSCGLSYKAICWAYVSEEGEVEFHNARKMTAGFTMREGSLECDALVYNEDDLPLFRDEADRIKECYGYMKDKTDIHEDIPFDEYRHPSYPEDILVYFLPPDKAENYEGIWVTEKERYPDGTLTAEVLNEPYSPLMGVHAGDLVNVIPLEGEDGIVLPIAMLPWMRHNQQ